MIENSKMLWNWDKLNVFSSLHFYHPQRPTHSINNNNNLLKNNISTVIYYIYFLFFLSFFELSGLKFVLVGWIKTWKFK